MINAESTAARRAVLRRHHTELTFRIQQARAAATMIEGALGCEHDDIITCPNFQALLRETLGDLPDAPVCADEQAKAMSTESRVAEAGALGDLGAVFRRAELPEVEVRVPRQLADRAVQAWRREDTDPVEPTESPSDRRTRHLAGALALIGCAITERGRTDNGDVVVTLPVELVGVAMDAAD